MLHYNAKCAIYHGHGCESQINLNKLITIRPHRKVVLEVTSKDSGITIFWCTFVD